MMPSAVTTNTALQSPPALYVSLNTQNSSNKSTQDL